MKAIYESMIFLSGAAILSGIACFLWTSVFSWRKSWERYLKHYNDSLDEYRDALNKREQLLNHLYESLREHKVILNEYERHLYDTQAMKRTVN